MGWFSLIRLRGVGYSNVFRGHGVFARTCANSSRGVDLHERSKPKSLLRKAWKEQGWPKKEATDFIGMVVQPGFANIQAKIRSSRVGMDDEFSSYFLSLKHDDCLEDKRGIVGLNRFVNYIWWLQSIAATTKELSENSKGGHKSRQMKRTAELVNEEMMIPVLERCFYEGDEDASVLKNIEFIISQVQWGSHWKTQVAKLLVHFEKRINVLLMDDYQKRVENGMYAVGSELRNESLSADATYLTSKMMLMESGTKRGAVKYVKEIKQVVEAYFPYDNSTQLILKHKFLLERWHRALDLRIGQWLEDIARNLRSDNDKRPLPYGPSKVLFENFIVLNRRNGDLRSSVSETAKLRERFYFLYGDNFDFAEVAVSQKMLSHYNLWENDSEYLKRCELVKSIGVGDEKLLQWSLEGSLPEVMNRIGMLSSLSGFKEWTFVRWMRRNTDIVYSRHVNRLRYSRLSSVLGSSLAKELSLCVLRRKDVSVSSLLSKGGLSRVKVIHEHGIGMKLNEKGRLGLIMKHYGLLSEQTSNEEFFNALRRHQDFTGMNFSKIQSTKIDLSYR